MTERDRLIELIQNAVNGCARHWAEIIADYLLANGVIVPPCKVGDTVFFINTCSTAEDFGKEFMDFGRVCKVSKDTEIVHFEDGRIRWWKDVFLTKEDAEQVLAERSEWNAQR
jgi:hypothetical protein